MALSTAPSSAPAPEKTPMQEILALVKDNGDLGLEGVVNVAAEQVDEYLGFAGDEPSIHGVKMNVTNEITKVLKRLRQQVLEKTRIDKNIRAGVIAIIDKRSQSIESEKAHK